MNEKPTVLYIDDDRDNLIVFKSTFRRYYQLHLASSANDGLDILRSTNVDVIVTDQRMPVMTGVELLKNAVVEFPNTARIILTGFSDLMAIIEAINEGKVDAYITKPWKKEELKLAIDNSYRAVYERKMLYAEIENLKKQLAELKDNS